MKNHLHLIAYIAVASFSAYAIIQGMEVLWFSMTLFINIILIGIELFFTFGTGRVTRDAIDAQAKKEAIEFDEFLKGNK